MRSCGIFTYRPVRAIQLMPMRPNAGFVIKKKKCSESDEMAVLSNPGQERFLCSDMAVKPTLFHNSVYFACWGGEMLARSGLVSLNQLCSFKLPQSPCSQGNGGRKGKNSLQGFASTDTKSFGV